MHAVLTDEGFRVALLAGAFGAALVWFLLRRGTVCLGYPFVAVVATLLGFRVEHRLGAPLVVGLGLLAVAECVATSDRSWLAAAIAAVPGGLVLAASLPDGFAFWLRTTVVLTTVVLSPIVVAFARRDPRLVAAMFAVSAVGLYACVPDTEHAKALLGGLLVAAVLGLDPRLPATLGVSALTGLFVWTAAFGGHGRPGSVVGGIACMGVIVLVPLAGWRRRSWVDLVAVLAIQVVLVAYGSRLAGFRNSAWSAAILCIPAFVLASVVLVAIRRRA